MFQEDIQMMRTDAIRKMQEDRFVRMVRYAYDRVPMYRRRFKEHGVTPDDIKGLEDAHKVPFTVKSDLRDHYPYGILAVDRKEVARFHASSGTTGKPTVVGYTKRDLDTWYRLMARSLDCAGLEAGDIMQNAYGYGLFTGGLGFHNGAETLGATVVPASTGNTPKQLQLINDMRSTALACTPSYAVYLGEKALEMGYDPPNDFDLRLGLHGAEPWSEQMRRRIQDTLGLRAQDFYGMSELYGPGVASECPEQQGLHIWADEFYVETIDPETGEVLEPGTKGELVVTMLTREAMPLLRYRTRDLCVINWESCSCGRSMPRIMRIEGRSDDMLIVGGVNVFPSQIEEVLLKTPGIGDQYQIIVDRDLLDRLTVKVEVAPDTYKSSGYDEAGLVKALSERMTAVLSIRANIELLEPGTLPRTEGKAKRVFDMRKKE